MLWPVFSNIWPSLWEGNDVGLMSHALKPKEILELEREEYKVYNSARMYIIFPPLLARYLLYILPNISMNLNTYFELYRMFDEH